MSLAAAISESDTVPTDVQLTIEEHQKKIRGTHFSRKADNQQSGFSTKESKAKIIFQDNSLLVLFKNVNPA